jgi:rubrerythrin
MKPAGGSTDSGDGKGEGGGCGGGGSCGHGATAGGHAGEAAGGHGAGGDSHAAAGSQHGGGGCQGHGGGGHGGNHTADAGAATTPLEASVRAALERALADERRAEAMYLQVVADHGSVAPFAHASHAENRHSEMILGAFRLRGETPAAAEATAAPPRFASLQEACRAAMQWEEENVALYDELLRAELPQDVRRVFEHNRRASAAHHLPAFQRCAG